MKREGGRGLMPIGSGQAAGCWRMLKQVAFRDLSDSSARDQTAVERLVLVTLNFMSRELLGDLTPVLMFVVLVFIFVQ